MITVIHFFHIQQLSHTLQHLCDSLLKFGLVILGPLLQFKFLLIIKIRDLGCIGLERRNRGILHELLSGFDTVKSCVDDAGMRSHIEKCVFDEIIPTLDLPREELLSYANSVLERFGNPYIKHYLSSIALNSVSKFKVRVLPSILEYIKRYNKMPETLLFAFAKLIEFYKTDMTNDAPEVVEFMKNNDAKAILANSALWGEDLSYLAPEVEKYIK